MPAKTLPPDAVRANRENLARVKKLLKERGHNQRYIAEKLTVSEATVSKWFSGQQNMTYGQFRRLMALLHAKPNEVMGGPEEQARLARYDALTRLAGDMTDEQLAALEAVAQQLAAPRKNR